MKGMWGNRRVTACAAMALSVTAWPAESQPTAPPTPPSKVTGLHAAKDAFQFLPSVFIPMRDGVNLSADLYLPGTRDQKQGTILIRLPYDKSARKYREIALSFAKKGFAVVVQDLRGKFESGGEYSMHEYRAVEDGYDTVEWIIHQPWSNGRVGGIGCSYPGHYSLWTAVSKHPAYVTVIPQAAGGVRRTFGAEIANFGWKRGGVEKLGTVPAFFVSNLGGNKIYLRRPEHISQVVWDSIRGSFRLGPEPAPKLTSENLMSLPLIDVVNKHPGVMPGQDWDAELTTQVGDPYWKKFPVISDGTTINASALHINSWFDPNATDTIELRSFFEGTATSEAAKQQYMVMSPTTHCRSETASENTYIAPGPSDSLPDTRIVSNARFVGNASLDYGDLYFRWFDYWLNNNKSALTGIPRIQYFVMGANEWRSTDVWPLPNTKPTRYYLTSAGHANTVNGDGVLTLKAPKHRAQDSLIYDPANPTPAVGGQDSSYEDAGSFDQRPNDLRKDVLVYTSSPLDAPLEVTGRMKLKLHVASSAPDTDFIAKLIDVYPDGTSYNISTGIVRTRYRDGLQKQVLMKPGQVYEVEIDMRVTSNVFLPGHRIRLAVQSADFPVYARNLNTGDDQYTSTSWVRAKNSVFHGGSRLSYITLPVVGR